jgi:transcriptional regulator with XRE-family HTH domain
MYHQRIKALRKSKGWTIDEMAELCGLSQSFLSRLESGKRQLVLPTAEKLAGVLGVKLVELLDIEPGTEEATLPGFSDDCTRYDPGPDNPLRLLQGENQYLYTVDGTTVEAAGIAKGDIVRIDIGRDPVKRVKALDIVQVRLHPEEDFNKPVTLLRQFVPPHLLITNSSTRNLPSIDMTDEDAHIVGVVVGSYKSFG